MQTTLHPITQVYVGAPGQPYRDSTRTIWYSNRYVNPYVGYEGRRVGVGVGVMKADRPFDADHSWTGIEDPLQGVQAANSFHEVLPTGHVRLSGERHRLTLRWMEDVPLESEGHFSADLGFRSSRQLETGVFVGLAGPYDGVMFGLRGRVWFTPAAALQIKASVSSGEGGEYGVYGSVIARLPGVH